jgi:hypothetical protein
LVSAAKGRLFKRKGGKYLFYILKSPAEDSTFFFKGEDVKVFISFKPGAAERVLTVRVLDDVKPKT